MKFKKKSRIWEKDREGEWLLMGVGGDKKRRDGDSNQDPFLYMPGICQRTKFEKGAKSFIRSSTGSF